MGHALQRMRYGDGAAMEHLWSVIASVAFYVPASLNLKAGI